MAATASGGRVALVEATLDLVAAEGAGAVTARGVAIRAGVSPGTVTHHFASVDALLVEALRHAGEVVIGDLERLALGLQDDDLDADGWAAAFGAALAHDIDARPALHIACFELRLAAVRRPELRPVSDAIVAAHLRVARIALRALGAPDPDGAAARLFAAIAGLLLAEMSQPRRGRRERMTRELAVLVRALAT